jgi:hypothetical protein
MRRLEFCIRLVVFLSLLSLAASPLKAQETRGSILGRITDPSGALVPGATITVTNEATNTKVAARSNDDGNYNVPFLPPGSYMVLVEATGFKKALQKGIVVQVQDRIALNFALEVGAVTETVSVTSEPPALQTANGDLGQVVNRDFLDRLPTAGQSPLNFADMAPGVVTSSGGVTSNAQNDISINGGNGKNRGNDVTVDGIPNISARQRGLAVTMPMADAVQEFKVNTTMFDASLGRSNGGSMSVTTRSGTNSLHGTAYLYFVNRALNANSWTNNRLGQRKPAIKVNEEGGTVGGPVRLPYYKGRNRTFFFFGFERTENARPLSRQARVPTALERIGDFSQTLAPNGQPIKIFNPFSTVVNSSGGFVSRAEFTGAKIPSNLLNPVGLAVLSQYPQPTISGNIPIGGINWTGSSTFTTTTKNFQARVDEQISSRQRLYVRFSALRHFQSPTPNFFDGVFSFPTEGETDVANDYRRNHSVAIDDTITFNSTFVASFRYGFTRTKIQVSAAGDGRDPAILKLPAIVINNQFNPAWSVFDISVDGAPSLGSRPRQSANDIHALLANFNKLSGNQTFRFGADYRLLRWNEPNPGTAANGRFLFNKTLTRSNPTSSSTEASSGSAMAALLLGLPRTTGGLGSNSTLSLQNHYLGLFFQDDIKVNSKLTVNLGMRWELETPFTERFDRLPYGFDPNAQLGITLPTIILPASIGGGTLTLPPLHGGLQFVNKDGQSRQQGKTDWNNFGPRVSFAYGLNDKTVVRGGYGIFYSAYAVNIDSGTPTTAASFNAITPYIGTTNNDVTVIPGVNLSNPFPNGLLSPTGSSLGVKSLLGNAITFVSADRVLPYIQQWQFSIQRALPWKTIFEAAYVGTHALKLYENFNLDELPDRFNTSVDTSASVPNPFLGVLPSNSSLGQGATIRVNKLRVPFPQFDQVNIQSMNTGRAQYHGLQLRLQKRLSNGLNFVSNYAFSKILEYTATSAVNPRRYRTVAADDRSHIFRLFATYDLPWGRGRAFGRGWPTWLDNVAGGWGITWVTKYTSGEPLEIVDGSRGRPIVIRDPNLPGPVKKRLGDLKDPVTKLPLNPYFDVGAFAHLPDFTASPSPVRYGWLRGPSRLENGVVLFKTISLFENVKFEVRGEISNIFNSPIFNNPGVDFAAPATFGVISSAGGNRSIQVGGKLRW